MWSLTNIASTYNTFMVRIFVSRPTNTYRIAENFRGRKLVRISWFCGYTRKFCPRNLGRGVLWHGKSEQSTKVFSAKIIFFTNSRRFSPSKVSRYMVHFVCPYGEDYITYGECTSHDWMITGMRVEIASGVPLASFQALVHGWRAWEWG